MSDYFVFNGIASTDKNISLIDYNSIFLPANNRSFISVPGQDGSIPSGNDSKQDVIINCEVAITGDTEEEIKQNIERANLWLSKRGKLTFWDMLDRYYIGEVIGEIISFSKINWDNFTLQFRCSPIKYGSTKTYDITNNPEIYNLGTYKTMGIIKIEITEDVSFLEVRLTNTGEFIYLDHDFIVGDIIKIDLEDEKAYKNGYSIMKDCYLESDFFEIPVGEFRITVSSGKATLEYVERWL